MFSASSSPSRPFVLRRPTQDAPFSGCIRRLREARGLAVAEAAELAGMQISEWAAIEEGWVPDDPVWLRPLAAVLEVDWETVETLAASCRGPEASASGPPYS